ncbi:MAG: PTS sugar transporter subunit IIA [Spirochaetales bacterium]|jgi:PTS system nitrogen regulatory IIA component|nr:PTS sugar transporter subunit IIA [Spirochaetales bacterium]
MCNTVFGPGAVVFEIKSQTKADAIKEIISRAKVFDGIFDKAQFEEAVFIREEQGSCVGHGVAFAHGKIPEISEMKTALGISRQGINYNAPDGRLVHFLFIVATNPSMHLDYLKRLAILAKMARMENFHNEILSCFAQEEVEEKLKRTFSFCSSQSIA